MRFDGNAGAAPNYEPGNAPGILAESPRYRDPPWALGDVVVDRYRHRGEEDHYTQPGDLFRLMDSLQQAQLIDNIAGSMGGVTREGIVERQLAHWRLVDAKLAAGIEARLKAR